MQSIQNAASVVIDLICSYLLYTEDVIRLKRTCKQFNQLDLYETSGHKQPHGVVVTVVKHRTVTCSYVYTYQDGMVHGRQYRFNIPGGVKLAEFGAQHLGEFTDYKRDVLHGLHHQYKLDENGNRYLSSSMCFENGDRAGPLIRYNPSGAITSVHTSALYTSPSSLSIKERMDGGMKVFDIQEGAWESESDYRRYTLRADGVLLEESYRIPRGTKKRKMRDLLTIEEASGGLFETNCSAS